MRPTRALALLTVLAVLVATALSSALVSPAAASPRKPAHHATADAKELGTSNRFVAIGQVSTYPDAKVRILRNAGGGKYQGYKMVKTRDSGKFRARIFQVGNRKTCFKLVVPATHTYRETTIPIACIVTV